MKSFDNKKIEDNLCDSWIDEEFPDDSYDGEDYEFCSDDISDEFWSDDILPDDDYFKPVDPKKYTYEKTKSILRDLNMKHIEKFLREMKLKKINNKNKKWK